MSNLFEDTDSEAEAEIKTDNFYAKNYDTWRQKEELNKLKTKHNETVLDGSASSSSSEDEDDDGLQITGTLERDFFKTLASLRTKDPKIYDKNVQFFTETSPSVDTKKIKEKNQPMYIKDYERKLLLESNGDIDDTNSAEVQSLTYVEEQDRLKNAFKDYDDENNEDDDDNETSGGGILKSRKKTDIEIQAEEEDYKQWLLGRNKDVNDDIKNDLKPLKDYWSNPKLEEDEKFLRDYILNKKFLDSDDKDYVPTYDEIIHDSDDSLSGDEKQIEKQEEFEYKYNYRFEEPDEDFIKRYPRTIENSLRRQDDKRKIKRAEVKERKQKEKQEKMEEVRQMHAFKRKEIEEKIQKLKEITGNTVIAFSEKDIEDDFDPDAHDKRMENLFNDEFYCGQEEEQKPEFPDLDKELLIDNWDKYDSTKTNEDYNNKSHCDDENFIMDCDYDPSASKTPETSKGKKRKRRRTKFTEVLSEPKPTFNPSDETYEEYLDEYYKLECEDIIGDIPCRFKYRKVTPNSFGLSIEEILTANDRELNKWCSLKKATQYRPEHVEKYDVIAFERKGRNESLKRKLLPSLFQENNPSTSGTDKSAADKEDNEEATTKKQKKHKKRNEANESNATITAEDTVETKTNKKSKNKNKHASNSSSTKDIPGNGISTDKEEASKDAEVQKSEKNSQTEANNQISSSNSKNKENKKRKRKNKKENNSNSEGKSKNKPFSLSTKDIPGNEIITDNREASKDVQVHKSEENSPSEANNQISSFNSKNNENKKRKRKNKKENKSNSKGKSKNKFSRKNNSSEIDITDARLKAFGIKPKRFKNKLKYGKKK